MTAVAHNPQLLGYLAAPCPGDPNTAHLVPAHIEGGPGTITSQMAYGPDTPVQPCPHCHWFGVCSDAAAQP